MLLNFLIKIKLMLEYFIDLFSEYKGYILQYLIDFLVQTKINVSIFLYKIMLMLQYFIDRFN